MSTAAAPTRTFLGHPPGLFVLFFAEMWERFSFYGMRALLLLYMGKGFLQYNDNRALAAQFLGLSRQSLYVKLRRYGLGDLGSDAGDNAD